MNPLGAVRLYILHMLYKEGSMGNKKSMWTGHSTRLTIQYAEKRVKI